MRSPIESLRENGASTATEATLQPLKWLPTIMALKTSDAEMIFPRHAQSRFHHVAESQ
jgi:hypothetical protein